MSNYTKVYITTISLIQSSSSTSHGQSSHQYGGGGSRNFPAAAPPFSMPFNFSGLPPEMNSMFMNMAGNVFPDQFQNGPEGESQAGPHNEPGVRVDGNMSFNVNELPEEISGAFRSMMGMFSGATSDGNQQDNNHGRPAPS